MEGGDERVFQTKTTTGAKGVKKNEWPNCKNRGGHCGSNVGGRVVTPLKSGCRTMCGGWGAGESPAHQINDDVFTEQWRGGKGGSEVKITLTTWERSIHMWWVRPKLGFSPHNEEGSTTGTEQGKRCVFLERWGGGTRAQPTQKRNSQSGEERGLGLYHLCRRDWGFGARKNARSRERKRETFKSIRNSEGEKRTTRKRSTLR